MGERAKLFNIGGNQIVRLPKSYRFPHDQREVIVRRSGRSIILDPTDVWSNEFLACLGALKEAPERPSAGEIRRRRDPFRT
jgi:virulence-associated protein VagC